MSETRLLCTTLKTTTTQEFVETAVAKLTSAIVESIASHDRCTLGLSGGTTPKPIYEALAKQPGINWSKVVVFLVDERYIEATHKDANTNLVRTSLLQAGATVPESQFIFPNTTLPLDECVRDYDQRLKSVLQGRPIDVVTLGMGDDGHIASLFPPLSRALLTEETACTQHTTTDRFAVYDRLTITLKLIVEARHQFFFLKGESKLKVWNEMLKDAEESKEEAWRVRWPALSVIRTGRSVAILGQ